MRISMDSNIVAHCKRTLEQRGVLENILADHELGDLLVFRGQEVQELGTVLLRMSVKVRIRGRKERRTGRGPSSKETP